MSDYRPLAPLALALCWGSAYAQTPAVFASGLLNPSKIILTPGGKLLVTECGQTPNSGRLSLIDASGTRSTLIDGLPSGLAAPDMSADGINGLALNGRRLYIAVGEGDSYRNGAVANTIVPNPAGPSSPIFASVLAMTLSADIDRIAMNFTMQSADQFTLADGHSVTLKNAAGDTAQIELLSAFRGIPDAHSIYRNSHPYSLALLDSQPNMLYMADAGMNTVVRINAMTGQWSVLARFPNTPNPLPVGPPTSEAVPTSVRAYGTHLLVSFLSGAPFAPGASRVVDLDPVTGTPAPFIPGLTSTIDTAFHLNSDGSTVYYALEYSLAQSATPPAPGQLFFVSTNGTSGVVAGGLNSPSALAVDNATGNVYIADRTDGTVLLVKGR